MEVFVKLSSSASLPEYKSDGAAGADLCANIDSPIILKPMERHLVPTGIAVQLPPLYELQVRPRSGLALKHGITVLNTPGTVDSDYRGELKILLINLGNTDFVVQNGDRIAQAVITKVAQVEFIAVSSLSQTERGSEGYGSTGV